MPRIRIVPESTGTDGDAAVEMMASYGLVLDDWQRLIISDWLAICGRSYASSMCGLSVPRQNGKTALVKARCIYGLMVLGETILYTAHEVKTARKTFDEMAELFDKGGQYPELAAQVEYIRRANGQEEIKLSDWVDEDGEWHKGGRIIFSARS